jgi:uncharacterized protein
MSVYSTTDSQPIGDGLLAISAESNTEKVHIMSPGVEYNYKSYSHLQGRSFQDQFCTAIYCEFWILPDGEAAEFVHHNELTLGINQQGGYLSDA